MKYDHLLKRIGSRIRQRRQELGLTQEDLAGDDYTKSYISQIEKGQTWPSLSSIILIARRLGTTVGYLIGESDTPSDDPVDVAAVRAGITPEQARQFLAALGDGAEGSERTLG